MDELPSRDGALDPSGTAPPRWLRIAVFCWAFLGVGMMVGAWSLATPLGAAPDEPNHIAQAAAIVRGQFDEPSQHTSIGPLAAVTVPEWVRELGAGVSCFAFKPHVPAGCAKVSDATVPVRVGTQFSNAPPLYYLVVGTPTIFLSGGTAVYVMRLTGDVVNVFLVALGMFVLWRYHPRRTPFLGVLIALTPMVLFLLSVVSSSGLEIAAAFATWCAAVCVVEYPVVPRALAIWMSIAMVLLIFARPTSPLDAAIIVVIGVVLVGWRGIPERLNRSLLPIVLPGSVAALISGVLLLVVGLPGLLHGVAPHPASLAANIHTTLGLTWERLRQCIGDFGWLDTPVPTWVVVLWASVLAGLTVVALVVSRSCRRALPVLALLVVAMPVVLESPQINVVGTYWQGRYWLPVVIGFPLVASTFFKAHVAKCRPTPRRTQLAIAGTTLTVGVALLVAQVACFEHALQRYEEGLRARSLSTPAWLPPGGNLLVTVVFVLGAVITLAFVVASMLEPKPPPV